MMQNRLRSLAAGLLLCGAALAQSTSNGRRVFLGAVDGTGAASTRPLKTGPLSGRPAGCAQGDLYFAVDAQPGRELYLCYSSNTWAQSGYVQGPGTALPGACQVGEIYFATDAESGRNLYFCTSIGTWTQMSSSGGGAVTSVFGRTGVVLPQSGDYAAAQVTNAVDATASYSNPPWLAGLAWNKLSGVPASFLPSAHAATHQNGGSDEIATATPGAHAIPKAEAAGTLAPGWLPPPTAGSLGGVRSQSCADGHINSINTDGSATCSADNGTAGNYQTLIGPGPNGSGTTTAARTQRAALQGRDNLAFDDDGANTILNFTSLDARTVWLDEEFIGSSALSGQIGTWFQSGLGGTSTTARLVGQWPNLGILQLTAGSTSPAQGNGLAINMASNGAVNSLGALGSNANWGFIWIFKLGATANLRVRIGVSNSYATDAAGSIGLRYDTGAAFNDTHFMFFVKGATGSDVAADTGIAADTNWHTLLVYSPVAGTLHMQLDGGTDTTFCASGGGCMASVTIPATTMDPHAELITDTNASQTLQLDAFKFKARVSVNAANARN